MTTRKPARDARLIGVGLDNEDGHVRVTQGKNFSLFMGSESTHEHMQELCIKLNEKLDRRGKSLDSLSPAELSDLIRESDPKR
ncbi:MAG: hypothetical protein H3C50_06940 [Kiritimatiellae bacterium]|nr:hypothetical protein [Kiritimatiellia bacterium]MCO5062542.1 hypothetical protein [Kiritimatiellia bacterium]MCO5067694.1 hypothetical protein [Kiritimatiellia bacterium]